MCKSVNLCFYMFAHICKNVFMFAHVRKSFCTVLQICKNMSCTNLTNVQMCKNVSCTKCANLQRKYFSKCRNHKSALCTKTQMQISAHVTNSQMHNSQIHNLFFVCTCKLIFHSTNNLLNLLQCINKIILEKNIVK